jgi:hypothetical protein
MKKFPNSRNYFPKSLALLFLLIAGTASAQRNWEQKPPGKLLQQSASCAGLAWGSAITGTAMMYIYTENGKTGFRDAGIVMYTGSLVLMANAWLNMHHAGEVMENRRVALNANQYGVGVKISFN